MWWSIHKDQYADATLYLRMMAFYEGRLRGCRVHDPSGNRVGCCCDHDGCCEDVREPQPNTPYIWRTP